MHNSTATVEYFLSKKSEEARSIAEKYSQNEEIRQAFAEQDREKIEISEMAVNLSNEIKRFRV